MYGMYFFLNIFGHILWFYNFDFIFEEELNIFEINRCIPIWILCTSCAKILEMILDSFKSFWV